MWRLYGDSLGNISCADNIWGFNRDHILLLPTKPSRSKKRSALLRAYGPEVRVMGWSPGSRFGGRVMVDDPVFEV